MLKAENEFSARRFLWRILWDEKYLKQQRTYFTIWLISPFNAIRCKTERNECVNLHNMRMSEVEWFESSQRLNVLEEEEKKLHRVSMGKEWWWYDKLKLEIIFQPLFALILHVALYAFSRLSRSTPKSESI